VQQNIYSLPEISFVGGETRDLNFRLLTDNGKVFSASGASTTFSIVNSVNRTGAPIISKPMDIIADDNDIDSILTVTLLPAETVNLFGKYIYQITIIDLSGEVEIPSQGILRITNNIDKNAV